MYKNILAIIVFLFVYDTAHGQLADEDYSLCAQPAKPGSINYRKILEKGLMTRADLALQEELNKENTPVRHA